MRSKVAFSFIVLSLIASVCSTHGQKKKKELPVVRIGTVIDGQWERLREIRSVFEREIMELTRGEFNVQCPDEKHLAADFSVDGINSIIDRLIADSEVDLIIAIGPLSSYELSQRKELSKPVIAPFILDPEIQKLPLKGDASGVKNLCYITFPAHIVEDIIAFRRIVPFTRLAMLFSRSVYDGMPNLRTSILKELGDMDLEVTIVPVGNSANRALASMPPDIQAVYLSPLIHVSEKEFDRLVAGLIQRKLPSFSLLGRLEVERGIFASAGPAFNFIRLARRVGLYVQRILRGDEAGELSVRFRRREQLTINMATARAINVFPNWRVLEQADLLNEEPEDVDRKLSLANAVREAIAANLDLAAAHKEVAAGAENVGLARSSLLPQLDISAQGVMIDKDRAEASFGSQAERTISGSATLSQLIYSEPAWANLSIQEDLQSALEEEREQLRLDITLDAATAYLNVLRAKTLQHIQKDNLKLTRSNLDLAQLRVAIGSAGRQEVFRWESEVASSRIDVITANAQRDQAEIALNQLLHRPLEEPFMTAEAGLEDSILLTSDQRLFTYTENPWYFEVFRDFMVQEGVAASPELRQLDDAIAAQERALTSANNAFWAPTIALQGDVTNIFSRSGAGSNGSTFTLPPPLPNISFPTANDLNWNLALRFSLPIFTGAERFVARTQAREALGQLRLEREATEERIEQRIRTAIHQAGVSYPAIRWSRAADTAAHQNLGLVTDAYSRGAVDITELIDAQNAALVASLAAENAVYDFLIDFMNVQRTIGIFDIFMSKEEREAWFGRLQSYFEKVGASPGKR